MMKNYRQTDKTLLSKTLGALLLLSLYCTPVHAQNEGRWYEVEVLIFKRQGTAALTSENWRNNIELTYPNRYRYLKSGGTGSFSLRPQNSHKLGGYNYTLRKKENYKVLYHKAWTQQMQNAANSPAIIINGGNLSGDHKELEGYIKIHIARYLHLTTDLWLTTNNTQTGEATGSAGAQWPKVPSRPGTTTPASVKPIDAQGLSTLTYDSIVGTKPIATLQERRRMRSKELHYIDHPLMGLLILITPIDK
ncbi:MAG: CsiV family protein [Cellvibrionaceae bacterium]